MPSYSLGTLYSEAGYTAIVGGGDFYNLTVNAGNTLCMKEGKTFAPAPSDIVDGNITINSVGSATTTDGSFYVASSSTFSAGGTLSATGNFFVDERATFTHNGYTTTFGGTITRNIDIRESVNTPTLGAIAFANTATTTMLYSATATDVTISSGAIVTAPATPIITDDFTNNGPLTQAMVAWRKRRWRDIDLLAFYIQSACLQNTRFVM